MSTSSTSVGGIHMPTRSAVGAAVGAEDDAGAEDGAELLVSQPIPIVQKSYLSWWSKWVLYKRFPWKFLLHCLLLFAFSLWMLVTASTQAVYARSIERTWRYFFYPADYEFSGTGFEATKDTLFRINDTVALLERSIVNYNTINEVATTKFRYVDPVTDDCIDTNRSSDPFGSNQAGKVPPLELEVEYYVGSTESKTITLELPTVSSLQQYGISAPTTEPVPWNPDNEPVTVQIGNNGSDNSTAYLTTPQDFFAVLRSMQVKFKLCNTAPRPLYTICYKWNVHITYGFPRQTNIELRVKDTIMSRCDDSVSFGTFISQDANFLLVIVLVIALIYLFLLGRSVHASWAAYRHVKNVYMQHRTASLAKESHLGAGNSHYDQHNNNNNNNKNNNGAQTHVMQYSWRELPVQVKVRLFSPWHVVTIVGVTLVIIAVCHSLFTRLNALPTDLEHKLLVGLAALVLWTSTIVYLERFSGLYAGYLTLAMAAPRLLPFVTGVVPIFIAFLFFGLAYFGDTVFWFKNFRQSYLALWALLNGDAVFDTFDMVDGWFPGIGEFFIFVFMCIFIYMVLNLFIAIIEEAYFMSRDKRRGLDSFMRDHYTHHRNENASEEPPPSAAASQPDQVLMQQAEKQARAQKRLRRRRRRARRRRKAAAAAAGIPRKSEDSSSDSSSGSSDSGDSDSDGDGDTDSDDNSTAPSSTRRKTRKDDRDKRHSEATGASSDSLSSPFGSRLSKHRGEESAGDASANSAASHASKSEASDVGGSGDNSGTMGGDRAAASANTGSAAAAPTPAGAGAEQKKTGAQGTTPYYWWLTPDNHVAAELLGEYQVTFDMLVDALICQAQECAAAIAKRNADEEQTIRLRRFFGSAATAQQPPTPGADGAEESKQGAARKQM